MNRITRMAVSFAAVVSFVSGVGLISSSATVSAWGQQDAKVNVEATCEGYSVGHWSKYSPANWTSAEGSDPLSGTWSESFTSASGTESVSWPGDPYAGPFSYDWNAQKPQDCETPEEPTCPEGQTGTPPDCVNPPPELAFSVTCAAGYTTVQSNVTIETLTLRWTDFEYNAGVDGVSMSYTFPYSDTFVSASVNGSEFKVLTHSSDCELPEQTEPNVDLDVTVPPCGVVTGTVSFSDIGEDVDEVQVNVYRWLEGSSKGFPAYLGSDATQSFDLSGFNPGDVVNVQGSIFEVRDGSPLEYLSATEQVIVPGDCEVPTCPEGQTGTPPDCETPEEPVCPEGSDSEGIPIDDMTDVNNDGGVDEKDCEDLPVNPCLEAEGITSINGPATVSSVDGECPEPPTDVCPNIDDNQSAVPDGMAKDDAGNCVVRKPNAPVYPSSDPPSTQTPPSAVAASTGGIVPQAPNTSEYSTPVGDLIEGKFATGIILMMLGVLAGGYVLVDRRSRKGTMNELVVKA